MCAPLSALDSAFPVCELTRLSNPATVAWAGLLYLSMYLCGKMHIMDRRGHAFKAWIAITPPIGATLIAVSRTMDYRHHATDVIAGSILGAVIAVMTYHLCAWRFHFIRLLSCLVLITADPLSLLWQTTPRCTHLSATSPTRLAFRPRSPPTASTRTQRTATRRRLARGRAARQARSAPTAPAPAPARATAARSSRRTTATLRASTRSRVARRP